MTDPCSFPYKNFVKSLEISLSPGRLELYEELAGGKLIDALQLYCWNTKLSQSLYWPLHAFEVGLRNAMADRIADAYGDDWYEHIATFSSSRRQAAIDEVLHVEKAKRKLDEDGLAYGHDAIVAAISLGFWLGSNRVKSIGFCLHLNAPTCPINEPLEKYRQVVLQSLAVCHPEEPDLVCQPTL